MELISRRSVLQTVGVITASGLAGCAIALDQRGDRQPTLRVLPDIERTEAAWKMDVWIRHTSDYVASIHDVTVVAFSVQGEKTCRFAAGDFPQGGRFEEQKPSTVMNFRLS